MVLEVKDFLEEHRFLILFDIIGFSKLSDDDQLSIIEQINRIIFDFINSSGYQKEKIFCGFIPVGDGFYIIGDETNSLFWGQLCLSFSCSLRNELINYFQSNNSICEGVRIALHFGSTRRFTDICGNPNFLGAGMNETARLLSPDNGEELNSISEKFYGHGHTIIVSQSALDKMQKLTVRDYKESDVFIVRAKHGLEIKCRFVDLKKIYKIL